MLCPLEVGTARGAKYFPYRGDPDPPALITANWAMMPFGAEPTALLAADVSAAQVTTIQGLPDVMLIPANLDLQLGANLATVQGELEALNVPADNIPATWTYRQVLRAVIAIYLVAQRFNGLRRAQLFGGGITLTTTLGDLSVAVRQSLQDAASQLGYDYSGLSLASSLREVLKKLASQPSNVQLMGVAI